MACIFCKKIKFLIWEGKKFSVSLFDNQYYIGRCIIKLNRHIDDFTQLTKAEQKDLFRIMKKLKRVLTKIFKPTMFNYAVLGNEVKHLHIHLIPRYKKRKMFLGEIFEDKNFGKPPWPSPKLKLSIKKRNEIKNIIKNELKK